MRILLTARCNYNCIFCHSEGLDPGATEDGNTAPQVVDLVKSATSSGFDDFTFSGGEPLLQLHKLVQIVDSLRKEFSDSPPSITVVTNGSLVSAAFIDAMAQYPGQKKVHVSLHSSDPVTYRRITGQKRFHPDDIFKAARTMAARGIPVKINTVVLNGINSDGSALRALVEKAGSAGISAMKLLELLVTPENESLFSCFYSAQAVRHALIQGGLTVSPKSHNRRIVLGVPRYPSMDVEVQQLTCKLGCSNCKNNRDITIGPDFALYPCFALSNRRLQLSGYQQLSTAIEDGLEVVAQNAQKYGDDSPVLVRQDRFVKQREVVFLETGLDFAEASKLLVELGFRHQKTALFREYFVRPVNPTDEWKNFQRVLKYGYEHHTPSEVQFIFSYNYFRMVDGCLFTKQCFLEDRKPPSCDSVERARRILSALDFHEYLAKDFELHEYVNGMIRVSLDKCCLRVNFRLDASFLHDPNVIAVIDVLQASPILCPFEEWLVKTASGSGLPHLPPK